MSEFRLDERLEKLALQTAVSEISEDEIYSTFYNNMREHITPARIEELHPYFYHKVLHYKGME